MFFVIISPMLTISLPFMTRTALYQSDCDTEHLLSEDSMSAAIVKEANRE